MRFMLALVGLIGSASLILAWLWPSASNESTWQTLIVRRSATSVVGLHFVFGVALGGILVGSALLAWGVR